MVDPEEARIDYVYIVIHLLCVITMLSVCLVSHKGRV